MSIMMLIPMPEGARQALDMVEDDELKEAILQVRRELCTLSTRTYVDAFDNTLAILKLELGQPDEEMGELLAVGLDEMISFAQSYTAESKAWGPGKYAPYDPKGKKQNV